MPRRAKSTQPVTTPTGLPYGMGKQLHDAQRAIPLPAPPSGADLVQPGQGTPAGGTPPPQSGGVPPLAGAMSAAQGMTMDPGGLLNQAPTTPEPITSGLGIGPGPGPEVLRAPDRTDVWHELYRITGDPKFLRFGMRARTTR